MTAYNFNPAAHNPRFGGGENLSPGKHPVVGTSVELKNARSNQGGYLELMCTAIDGPEKGGRKAIRYNLMHSNPETVRIAEEQLAATSIVMGLTGPWADTDALLNKPFVIEVALQPGDNPKGYTDVVAVYTMDGKTAGQAAQSGGANNAQAGGFNGFGGGQQQQPQTQNNGAAAGAWGGAAAGQEVKTEQTQQAAGGWGANAGGAAANGTATGTGWGAGAAAGQEPAAQSGGASGWQQNSGGGGAGWGQSA